MPKILTAVNRSVLLLTLLVAAPAILEAQEPAAATPGHEAHALTAEQRAQYVGTYEVETPDGPMAIHIYEEGERLMGRPENDDQPSPLVPLGEHRFQPVLSEGAVLTFVVEDGRAVNFSITFPDERGTMTAVRRPS